MTTDESQLQSEHLDSKRVYKVSPDVAYDRVSSGEALLVCAYKSEFMYRAFRLKGSISYEEFESRLVKLRKDQEIIFY